MKQAKLIRDKIPQIIRDAGDEPIIRIAAAEEFLGLLREKLSEEVDEFLRDNDPNELADILEVVLTLAQHLGINRHQLERLRAAKAEERGGFSARIVWAGNIEDSSAARTAGSD